VNRLPVVSTNLKSVGWEKINEIGVLEVEFQSGEVYRYSDVLKQHYDALITLSHTGGSVGGYFNAYIKLEHRVERVNKTSSPESIVVTPIKVEDDPYRQILTIEGVPYAYEFFRNFACPDEKELYQFKKTELGITVTKVTPAG
jgi:hypothetical protein